MICLSMLDAAHLPSCLVPAPIRLAAKDFSPSRRASFLAGRSLLAAWCQLHHGCSELPEMVMGPHGRPAFSDPSLPEFSISHSGDWLWLAIGETSLGLDVEQHRPLCLLSALVDVRDILHYDWGGAALATLYGYMSSASRGSGQLLGGYWRAWEVHFFSTFSFLSRTFCTLYTAHTVVCSILAVYCTHGTHIHSASH